jgi:hypothetical protein
MRLLTWFPVENQLPEIRTSRGYAENGTVYQGLAPKASVRSGAAAVARGYPRRR